MSQQAETTAPDATRPSTAPARVRPYRLSVAQYLRMIEAGVFPDTARVELLGGILVEQMTKGNPHDSTLGTLSALIRPMIPGEWLVREDKSLELTARSRLEPDLAIVPGPGRQYFTRAPRGRETILVVEVAESFLAHDRHFKWLRYAAARVPVYWIVNLTRRQVEVYRDPAGRGKNATYRVAEVYPEDVAVPVVIAGVEVGRIAIREILP